MDDLRAEAVFGLFDAATSVIGVIAGLAVRSAAIPGAVVGLAVAAALGMGAGEFLSDDQTGGSLTRAAAMAAATVVGTVTPAVPFLLGLPHPGWFCAATVVALGALIAHLRPDHERVRAYVVTYGLLLAAAGVTLAVEALTGAGS